MIGAKTIFHVVIYIFVRITKRFCFLLLLGILAQGLGTGEEIAASLTSLHLSAKDTHVIVASINELCAQGTHFSRTCGANLRQLCFECLTNIKRWFTSSVFFSYLNFL